MTIQASWSWRLEVQYEFTTDSQNSTATLVDASPADDGDADFVTWLTDEALAPSLAAGAVNWPDAVIEAEAGDDR